MKSLVLLLLGVMAVELGWGTSYYLVGDATLGAYFNDGAMWSSAGSGGTPDGGTINWSAEDIMVIDEYSVGTYGNPTIIFNSNIEIATLDISSAQTVTFWAEDLGSTALSYTLTLSSTGTPLSVGVGCILLLSAQLTDFDVPLIIKISAGTGTLAGTLGSDYGGSTLNILSGARLDATGIIYGTSAATTFSVISVSGILTTTQYVNSANFTVTSSGYFKTAYTGTRGWWNSTIAPTVISIDGTVDYSKNGAQIIASTSYGKLILSGASSTSKQKRIYGDVSVTDSVIIGNFSNLDLGTAKLSFQGHILNNYTITSSSQGRLIFNGSTAQNYTGTGTASIDTLIINSSYAGNVNISAAINPIVVFNVKFSNVAGLNNGSKLTVGKSPNTTRSSISFVGDLITTVGSLQATPNWNIGSDGFRVYYKTESSERTTGYELPASLTSVFVYNPSGVKLNSNVAVTTSFQVANGGTNLVGVLDAQDKEVTGAGAFSVSSATTIKTSHANGLNGTSQVSGSNSFSTGANYHFYAAGTQTAGTYLPATVGSMTVAGTSDLSLSNTSLTVTNACTINASTKLNIGATQDVTVSGTLTNTPGTSGLLLKSTASGIGSLKHTTAGVSGTVQRYVAGTNNDHYFSTPLSAGSLRFDNIFSAPDWDPMYVWIREFNESTGAWVNKHHSHNAVPGKGYASYIPTAGTEVPGVGIAPAPPNPPLSIHAGTLGVGTIPYSLSYSGTGKGWNFLGNPYPSAIDWDLLGKTGSIDGTVYVWSNGNYITWNGSTGSLTDGIIPVGMSFFVKTSAAAQTLTFENADRVHGNGNYWKSETLVDKLLSIKVTNDKNSKKDAVYINFNPEASRFFDPPFDGWKMHGDLDAPEVYTTGDTLLATNVLRAIDETPYINMGFKAGLEANYTFMADGMESFESGTPLYLEDMVTGVRQNLREFPVYQFSSGQGTFDNRFRLWFAPVGIEEPGNYILETWATGNIIHVAIPEGCKGAINIYNIFGQLVTSVPAGEPGIIDIPLNSPAGAYVVQLSTPVCKFSSKVITR